GGAFGLSEMSVTQQSGWTREVDAVSESERLRNEARRAMSVRSWSEGAELLRRAIDLDPMSINFELLGDCLLALGQTRDAVVFLAAGTGLGHNQFKTRVKLAKALHDLGEPFVHDALWQLEEALRINPGYKVARSLLAQWVGENPSLEMFLNAASKD